MEVNCYISWWYESHVIESFFCLFVVKGDDISFCGGLMSLHFFRIIGNMSTGKKLGGCGAILCWCVAVVLCGVVW